MKVEVEMRVVLSFTSDIDYDEKTTLAELKTAQRKAAMNTLQSALKDYTCRVDPDIRIDLKFPEES